MQKFTVMNIVFTLFLSWHALPDTSKNAVPPKAANHPAPSANNAQPPKAANTPAPKTNNAPLPKTANTPAPSTNKPAPSKADIKKQNAELAKLADAIQKQYNLTKSATFRFEQTYTHPFLSGPESNTHAKGNASYDKSSGSMMWNYTEPKNRLKQFYIKGRNLTFYSISDNNAFTHDCYDKDTLSASVAFLLGTGNLKGSFTIEPFDGEIPNKALSWISLIPKEPNPPVKKISLGATKDGKVVESIVEDPQPSDGKNHFKFLDFKVNPQIDSKIFDFKPPKGVRVQPMPNVKCAPSKPAEKPAPTPSKSNAQVGPAKKK